MDDQAQYEVLSAGADEPGRTAPAKRRPIGRVFGIGSLLLAVVAGAAVYTASRNADASDLPESVMPRTAFAFARVDLEPGGSKDGLEDFVRRFPAARAQNSEELRERAVTALAKSLDLDYAKDVKPWLGRHIGIAGFPGAQGRPKAVIALQTSDAPAALVSLRADKRALAVAQRGDYVLVASEQADLDSALAVTDDSPLAKDDDFVADIDKLRGSQISVVWSDNSGVADAMLYDFEKAMGSAAGEAETSGMDAYIKSVRAGAIGRTVLGLHATGTYAEIVGHTAGRPKSSTGDLALLRGLPDTTVGAGFAANGASLFGDSGGGPFTAFGILAQLPGMRLGSLGLLYLFMGSAGEDMAPAPVQSACAAPSPTPGSDNVEPYACEGAPTARPDEPAISPAAPAATATLAPAPAEPAPAEPSSRPVDVATGPKDPIGEGEPNDMNRYEEERKKTADEVTAALTGGVTLSLGSLPTPGSKNAPDLALIADSKDAASANVLLSRISGIYTKQFAGQPFAEVKAGSMTVASSAGYAAKLSGGGLGKTDLFELAMGDLGNNVELAVFVNLERVRDVVPGYPRELLPVSAVGISSSRQGDDTVLRIRVVSR